MNTWITTDWHKNHDNIKEYENRPDDFEQLIIDHHNELIEPMDTLINLGDLIFARQKELHSYLDQINCKHKILIRGNHDYEPDEYYLDNGFDAVMDAMVTRFILLSHAPMPISDDMRCNVHGHFHSGNHRLKDEHYYPYRGYRHVLLGIENTNYYPVSLEDIINGRYTKTIDGHSVIIRR